MSKRKPVNYDALVDAVENPIEPIKKLEAQAAGVAPSRAGKVQIGVHVAPETRAQLKVIAAQRDMSVKALMEEGIELVVKKYAK